MEILAIGEILWDVFEGGEFLGGAPLNFSATAQRLGNSVALVTGVGNDRRGRFAIESMEALGLSTNFAQILPGKDTGVALVTTDGAGNASYSIPRPAAFDAFQLDEAQLAAFSALQPGWIYFGTLAQTDASTLANLLALLQRLPDVECFYDMNLREGHWNLPLVQRLSASASIVKLNETEAETLHAMTNSGESFSLEAFSRFWSATYNVDTLCITLGSKGCAVFCDDSLHCFEGVSVNVQDTVGAGDAFAAAFLHGRIQGWPLARQAAFANAMGALVASRAGATPDWTVEECLQLIAQGGA